MQRRRLMIAGGAVGAAGIGVAIAARVEIGSVAAYDRVAAERRAKLPEAAELPELVRCATLAANSHNTQPWRFRRVDAGVAIMPDLTRRTDAVARQRQALPGLQSIGSLKPVAVDQGAQGDARSTRNRIQRLALLHDDRAARGFGA